MTADNVRIFECFREGTHTSMAGMIKEWTALDLERISRNHHFLQRNPPLVLGHPATDSPSYGEVTDLFVKGSVLYAVATCSAALIDMVRKGMYTGVSCAFSAVPDLPGMVMRHIGFLGAAAPAVKGLAPLQFAERYDAGPGVICFASGEHRLSLGGHNYTPPPGWRATPASVRQYQKARQVQADCPDLSFSEAASLAGQYIRNF